MAVDYAVPLITNVKNAKLLIEALARNIALDVNSIDAQTSHNTIEMPGLVNISTYIPTLQGHSPAYSFEETTKTAVASGFTFASILPLSSEGPTIVDARSLSKAHETLHGSIFTDFAFSVAATEDNANLIEHVSGLTSALYLPSKAFGPEKLSAASTHFASWVESKPIVTDCRTTDLASTLLLASLYNKKIHVTGVTRKEDLALVQMSKEKNLAVTCDVSVYALFLTKEDYPGVSFLPSKEDQKALWDNIEIIDAFSVGTLPSRLAEFLGKPVTPGLGFADTLPLLFRAVTDGKLTIADIISKLHDAPIQILGLTDNESTIEVDTDRLISSLKGKISSSSNFSPFAGQPMKGAVERVHMNGQTVCLEGDFLVKEALGKESAFLVQHSSKLVESSQPDTPLGIMSPLLSNRRSSRFSFDASAAKKASIIGTLRESVVEDGDIPTGADLVSSKPPRELAPPNAISSYIKNNNPFLRQSILSVKNISRANLHALFAVAQEMRLAVEREGVLDILKGRVLTTAFFEPSTRTASSFNAAMQRLGGRVVPISEQGSSVKKGETLQDTIRTMACYSDAIVLRHPDEESADIAAKYSPVPIINGGNGSREHPTQAMLDLFTMREELGTVNGITITFMGDLKYGRPVHSLCKLLQHYQVRVQLVSPKELRLPNNLKQQMLDNGLTVIESEELTKDLIAKSDVLYSTHVCHASITKSQ
ncbi:unnamed protein product [Ambrosiozyma monospora]|uniref:Unnamed protein product n=1 Tax=Ambrosiozyma monospora TaxID=43982 RepID=A0ACB5T2G0_AMBMO|nr:unnamed protein product [Ambrosiozyma monospora]